MKKLIYFLTILFSTHYLLAQNDNRLKAINQVTGDRLQVVGSNQKTACTEQDNNRLKETEKQTTDNREAELASGNQIEHRVVPTTNHELRTTNCGNSAGSLNYHLIGQGAKFTTNDERRTTNCDNQDVNLDCYLMMNPEEINKAEEAFGFTRMDVLPYRSTTLSTIEGSMSTEGETSISAVISEQEDVIENNAKSTEDGNMVSYKFLEEDFINVEEKILELKNQIEEIEHVRLREYISEQSYCRDCIIAKLEQSIDSWKRFNELLSQGNEERASQWKKVAEESEVAAKSVRNLVMNCLYLRQSEDGQFRKGGWNSYYLSDLSTWELKSKEAFERANEDQDEKKDFWRDLATQYQEAAEYERKASEMHNLRRENEENAYARIGRCLYSIANRKFKAMRARELGKNELIVRCQEAGETFRKAAEQWKLSVEKQIEGKEDESNILGEIGKFLQEKGDCQVKAIETKKTDSWTARIYLGDIERLQKIVEILQEALEQCRLATSYQAKAIKDQEAGKIELAVGYQEAAVTLQHAISQYRKSVQAYVKMNAFEGDCLNLEGKSLQKKAAYQIEIVEMKELEHIDLVVDYQNVILELQEVTDRYKKAFLAFIEGRDWRNVYIRDRKEEESKSWHEAAKSLWLKIDYREKTIRAEKAGKEELVTGYQEVVQVMQEAANQWKLAAEKYILGKQKEAHSLGEVGKCLQEKAGYHIKALETQELGKGKLVKGYQQAAEMLQEAATQWKLAVEKYAFGKEEEGITCGNKGKSLQRNADYQVKMIERKEKKEETFVDTYNMAIEILKEEAEYYEKATEAFAQGKENEGTGWKNVGMFLRLKVEEELKAIEDAKGEHSKGDDIKKDNKLLTQVIKVHEPIFQNKYNYLKLNALSIYCDQWLLETRLTAKPTKILSDYTIDLAKRGADYKLVKVFEKYWNHIAAAHQLGDDLLALSLIQVAEDIQQALEDSIKSKKNTKNSRIYYSIIQEIMNMAEYREKYIYASMLSEGLFSKSGKKDVSFTEIVSALKKVVEQSECIVSYYRQSLGKDSYNYLDNNNKALKTIFQALDQSLDEAIEGEFEISMFWRKIAEQRQILFEHSIKTVDNIETVGAKLIREIQDHFTSQFYSASAALEKGINAKKAQQEEIANLWFKMADKYQKLAEYGNQTINPELSNNAINEHDFFQAKISLRDCISQLGDASAALEKGTQFKKENQEEIAVLWLNVFERSQTLADYYNQVINARLNSNITDFRCFSQAKIFVKDCIFQLRKIGAALTQGIQAKKKGQGEIAAVWFQIVREYQKAVECYEQVINIKLNNNEVSYCYLKQANSSAKNCTFQLDKAFSALTESVRAKMQEQKEIAAFWFDLATKYQKIAEYYNQVAKNRLSNDEATHSYLAPANASAKNYISQLDKAFSALRKGMGAKEAQEKETAILWFKTSEEYQKSGEYYNQAIKAAVDKDDINYDRLNQEGSAARRIAARFAKSAIQKSSGKIFWYYGPGPVFELDCRPHCED